ncbi:MAG: DUF1398 family protein [Hyphomicrobium sp.]|jgi:uncharacterized protein YbcV (DUF1398 family)|nr:DUF1398 family protein [Hyphomicrobium sp.]
MNEQQESVAKQCLKSAYEGTMDFPDIVGALIAAGFEGYSVDYQRGIAVYYLPSGESLELSLPQDDTGVAINFDQPAIQAAIREAQSGQSGYSYKGFCRNMKAAGCANYIVSFPGRRVLYIGRTAETHVELFPS